MFRGDTTAANWAALLALAGGTIVLGNGTIRSDGQKVLFRVGTNDCEQATATVIVPVESLRDAISELCADLA